MRCLNAKHEPKNLAVKSFNFGGKAHRPNFDDVKCFCIARSIVIIAVESTFVRNVTQHTSAVVVSVISILKKIFSFNSNSIIPSNSISISNFHFTENSYFNSNSIL